MEIGTIRSIDECGGTIERVGNPDIRFFSDRVIGRDRKMLHLGDEVWFEIECLGNRQAAINIRRYHG